MARQQGDEPIKEQKGPQQTGRQGDMTVEEAGRRGGQKGGERVRELIEEGKEQERRDDEPRR